MSLAHELPLAWSIHGLLDGLARSRIGIVVFLYRFGGFEKCYANEPALQPLGYTLADWLAAPVFQTIEPSQRPLIALLYERLSNDAPMPAAIELTLVCRDGRRVRREYEVGRGPHPEGSVLVLIARNADPDPEPQALSLLEADRHALVGALASGFAHETNNPLTSMVLNLRSLRKQVVAKLPEDAQNTALRCVDDLTTASERIASNVRALQALATRSASQVIDLAALVSSALRLASPTLEPRAHVIRQIFPVRTVVGEESRLGQAVLSMLLFSSSGFSNELAGREQSRDHGRIVVAVEERGDIVVVEVSDNGSALTEQEVEHAFDPFFRSPVRGGGVGVGLGIARSIAATLGGEVTLAPRAGGGAVITMGLPAAPARA